jgi:hypothetical protein
MIEILTLYMTVLGWLRGHLGVAVNETVSMIEMIPYMKSSWSS